MLMVRPNKPKPKQSMVMVKMALKMAKTKGNFEGVFSENMGSSHTNRYEVSAMSANRKISPHTGVVHAACSKGLLAIPTISNALAGVGMPIKEWCWRVSKLNFAKRTAEKAAMINAV